MSYSSPTETISSESCNSSSSSSSSNESNEDKNENNELIDSIINININDYEEVDDVSVFGYGKNNSSKRQIDFNLLNDDRVLKNLLKVEDSYTIPCNYFMFIQQEVKLWMRVMLANWMLDVCENQKCDEGVFVLSMNIMDRFLCVQEISKRHLQLLGSACMFIASKIRCSTCLNAETLVIYTDRSISIDELLDWEQFVLQKLHWDVHSVPANDFIPFILPHLSFLDTYTLKMVQQHLAEIISLCSIDFRFSILTSSMIASASILNIINLLIDDDSTYNRVVDVLNEITLIEIDCLLACKEQIEDMITKSYQLRPELAEMLSMSKFQSRQRVLSSKSTILSTQNSIVSF